MEGHPMADLDCLDLPHSTECSTWRWGPAKAQVGIIGGMGEMGRLFTRFFTELGYAVNVSDCINGQSNETLVEASDIVLFSVPLHETERIIEELVSYTRVDQLLMDLSSLKTGPVEAMLRSPAFVVGLHPMFGGRISSFRGQTLVACPARVTPSDWSGLRGLFTQRGIRVKETTPETHDRMMSIIQVLFHVETMLAGRVLRELGIDVAETMEYTSPSYRLEMTLLGRIFAQNGALYSAITQRNPYTKDILACLRDGLSDYEQWYGSEDLHAFVEDFGRSAEYLGDFCRQAFRESSSLLDFSVQLSGQNL